MTIRPVIEDVSPTQQQLVAWFGITEVPLGMAVDAVHFGEDGPGFDLRMTRRFNLSDQEHYSGEFSDWYLDEYWDQEFAADEATNIEEFS